MESIFSYDPATAKVSLRPEVLFPEDGGTTHESTFLDEVMMLAQHDLFKILVDAFLRKYPRVSFSREDVARTVIDLLSPDVRRVFDSLKVKHIPALLLYSQYGTPQNLLRLLELAQPGKSVDQILQECLNDLERSGKNSAGNLARFGAGIDAHRLRIRTSLVALIAPDLRRN